MEKNLDQIFNEFANILGSLRELNKSVIKLSEDMVKSAFESTVDELEDIYLIVFESLDYKLLTNCGSEDISKEDLIKIANNLIENKSEVQENVINRFRRMIENNTEENLNKILKEKDAIIKLHKEQIKANMSYRAMLFTLTSATENFLKEILEYIYRNYDNKEFDINIKFSLSDLNDYDSIDHMRDELLKKQIDSVFWGNIESVIKEIQKYNKSYFLTKKELNVLYEIFARRNIHMHNNGKINQAYIYKVTNESLSIGEELMLSAEYLESSILNTIYMSYIITFAVAINSNPKNKDEYVNRLLCSCVELIDEKDYFIAKQILNKIDKRGIYENTITKYFILVNKYLIKILENEIREKDMHELEKIQKELKFRKEDTRELALGINCLRGQKKEFIEKIREVKAEKFQEKFLRYPIVKLLDLTKSEKEFILNI
ncbi:MAG: hypothetical protein N4A47_03925 [Clostridia bacterium]|jgi:hypothetical protein|nr:hypothetical protein [Clostridia bacterium]